MIRAGTGLSSNPDAEGAAREAVESAMGEAAIDRADVAALFVTSRHARQVRILVQEVRSATGCEALVGCSGVGVFTAAGEIAGGPGISLLVAKADRVRFHPFLVPNLPQHGDRLAEAILDEVGDKLEGESVLVLLPDTFHFHHAPTLAGMQRRLPRLPVVGGGASTDGSLPATFQICGDRVEVQSLVGLLVTGELRASTGITQACYPLGEPYVVTGAEDHQILEIAGRPAFQILRDLAGEEMMGDLRRVAATIFAALSLVPEQTFGSGEYVVRNIIGIDPDSGSLVLTEPVLKGQSIAFMVREPHQARRDADSLFSRMSRSLDGRQPEMALYFNCCGRGPFLHDTADVDTALIRRHMPGLPCAGFFTGCELAPVAGRNSLHLYSGIFLGLSEQEDRKTA